MSDIATAATTTTVTTVPDTAAPVIELDLTVKFSVNLPIVGHVDIATFSHQTKQAVPIGAAASALVNADLPAAGLQLLDFSSHGVTAIVRLDPGVAAA